MSSRYKKRATYYYVTLIISTNSPIIIFSVSIPQSYSIYITTKSRKYPKCITATTIRTYPADYQLLTLQSLYLFFLHHPNTVVEITISDSHSATAQLFTFLLIIILYLSVIEL